MILSVKIYLENGITLVYLINNLIKLDEDYDGVLGETGFSRHDNIRSRNEYDINEIRQRLSSNPTNPNKELTAVGSKMRRGDHLPGGGNSASLRRGLNTTTFFGGESVEVTNGTPFRYRQQPSNRLSRNQNTPQHQRRPRPQSDTAQMSSNTSSVSGQMSPRQYHQYADESDEDVMIPNELMSPTNGQRRTLAELDSRNYASYNSQHQQRIGKSTVNSDTRKYHYGLSYPDHLYCKHHRFYNWHSSISGDSISPDITNCKAEPNLKLSDKEGDILSHSHLRSPSLEQQLSPGNFMVIDRSVKQAQISSTGIRHKSQLKTNNSIANDRHDVSETFVTMYTEPSQVYPIIDLNQQIASGIPLNSSAQLTLESSNPHSTSVFTKLSMANVHRQEFYTINDEDDLEINWPKETVNV